MVKLFCAIVGEAGSAFPVVIDAGETVGDLKKAIKAEKSNDLKGVDADKLQLFLAKTEGGAWLKSKDLLRMRKGEIRDEVESRYMKEELDDPTDEISAKFPSPIPVGSIHVLVKPPLEREWPIGIEPNTEIQMYRGVAQTLKDSDEVEQVVKTLTDVNGREGTMMPFVILENSSGTGKSQMAFNLQANGAFDVFYVLCTSPEDRAQSVYRAFAARTAAFTACIESDTANMKAGSIGEFASADKLKLYAFIIAALRGDNGFRGKATHSAVLAERDRRNKPCVFFLDEFPRVGNSYAGVERKRREKQIRSMRNVFRSLRLPIIISATNGTARNLLVASEQSRESSGGAAGSPWCVVIPSLPLFVTDGHTSLTAGDMNDADTRSFEWIVQHSRPLFGAIARRFMEETPYLGRTDQEQLQYLNDMAKTLAIQIRDLKEPKRPKEFKLGQFCLFLGSSYKLSDERTASPTRKDAGKGEHEDEETNLIDSHFGRLEEHETFELTLGPRTLLKDGKVWRCRCVFPSPKDDILLHLTLMGDHESSDQNSKVRPLDEPLVEVMQHPFLKSRVSFRNLIQKTNDGSALEALVAAAVVLASHQGGFRGVMFKAFFSRLLYELGVRNDFNAVVELPKKHKLKKVKIPFLSAPNMEWPKEFMMYWNARSANFANMGRTCNAERVDFRCSDVLSGECKDRKNKCNLQELKEILERVPETDVHLVVVRAMQQDYFTRKSNSAPAAPSDAKPADHEKINSTPTLKSEPEPAAPKTLPESAGEFLKRAKLQNADFYRISKWSGLTEFSELMQARSRAGDEGASDEKNGAGKTIIFVEVGDWNTPQKRGLSACGLEEKVSSKKVSR